LNIILNCSIYLLLYIVLLYDRINLTLVPRLWFLKYTIPYWIFVHISCFRILHICQYNEMSLFSSLSWPPIVLRNAWYEICRLEPHLGLLIGCWLQTEILFRLPTGLTVFILFLIVSTGSVIPIQRPKAKVQQVGLQLVLESRLRGFLNPHFNIASLLVQGQSYLTKITSSKDELPGK
jgi:hypothetical protein